MTLTGASGSNILEKMQLTSNGTVIKFFKNINQFKHTVELAYPHSA